MCERPMQRRRPICLPSSSMTPERLADLHGLCFEAPARAWTSTEFKDLLDQPTVFLCALAHGFALGRAAGPEAELLTLAVDPSRRREGIGSNLLAGFEETAASRSVAEIFLEVAEHNSPARALYRRAGYDDVGRRAGYYPVSSGAEVDAIVMRKMLT
ncbi:GNAT family N-acetyltransferase [Amaricoccus tamworthensis]|uniref:GNAT family N-acetyltransferase n=1 Tax=Amaricoccus tamworthensis TaxID=57002 RepID=UPI003C7D5F8B